MQEIQGIADPTNLLALNAAIEAQDVVSKVFQFIADISDLAIQISTASEEQSLVLQEISRNIININDISQSNLSHANKVEVETSQINQKRNN